MFGNCNGQIKLHAKQKFKFLSATNYKETAASFSHFQSISDHMKSYRWIDS